MVVAYFGSDVQDAISTWARLHGWRRWKASAAYTGQVFIVIRQESLFFCALGYANTGVRHYKRTLAVHHGDQLYLRGDLGVRRVSL